MAPPGAYALSGYRQTYVTDFSSNSLPKGWGTYSGTPGDDPGTQWEPSQVVVSNGVLQLNANFDSKMNEWITGGTSQNNVSSTYGAYFVRSRMTAPGATMVELLWPTSGSWPPEIDFNETSGQTNGSTSTLHFSSANEVRQQSISIDMTQWHTWGVIWTPTSITYTIDGKVWGTMTVANDVPAIPMHLAIQQQTWCSKGFACPSGPASDIVDWVVEYRPSAVLATGTGVGGGSEQIEIDTSLPASRLNALTRDAALKIALSHAASVTLNVVSSSPRSSNSVSDKYRLAQIISILKTDLRIDHAKLPQIRVHWSSTAPHAPGFQHLVVRINFA